MGREPMANREAEWMERIERARELWQQSKAPPPPLEEDRLMSTAEAAAYRGVTVRAIRIAIERGTLTAIALHAADAPVNRRTWRVWRSELDRFGATRPVRPNVRHYLAALAKARPYGFLTIAESAKMIGVSRSRVVALCTRKRNPLPRTRIEGVWFIQKADVQALIDDRAADGILSLPKS